MAREHVRDSFAVEWVEIVHTVDEKFLPSWPWVKAACCLRLLSLRGQRISIIKNAKLQNPMNDADTTMKTAKYSSKSADAMTDARSTHSN